MSCHYVYRSFLKTLLQWALISKDSDSFHQGQKNIRSSFSISSSRKIPSYSSSRYLEKVKLFGNIVMLIINCSKGLCTFPNQRQQKCPLNLTPAGSNNCVELPFPSLCHLVCLNDFGICRRKTGGGEVSEWTVTIQRFPLLSTNIN